MNNMRNFIFLFCFLSLAACNKFLTVTPKTQMTQDDMFKAESGFEDALTGIYIEMKSSSAYGQALTMTSLEYLVSSWDVTSSSTQQKIANFNYTDADVQTTFSSIFSQEYTIIANINSVLGQIDTRKSVFTTPGMYELIKSECLALRAYCHLDLLRLFGPIPTDPDNGNQLAYVTVLSNSPNAHISFDKYKEALLNDLTQADALSKDVDPITQYSLSELKLFEGSTTDSFQPSTDYLGYRYIRMNYYAIKALEARAYLWFGEKDKAYTCAMEVVNAQNPDGSMKFRLGTASDYSNGDYVLTPEHIFGLYAFDMYNTYTNYFASGSLKKGTSSTQINSQLYGNTGTDIRETYLWNTITLSNQSKCYVIKKYNEASEPSSLSMDFKQIPMLRISEMYLIAIETGAYGQTQNLWDAFCTARNVVATDLPTDPVQLQNLILKEYRKEFYAEGQSFYAYKRLNASISQITFAPTTKSVNYLLPMPTVESVTNN